MTFASSGDIGLSGPFVLVYPFYFSTFYFLISHFLTVTKACDLFNGSDHRRHRTQALGYPG
jgi:hypothetical protein